MRAPLNPKRWPTRQRAASPFAPTGNPGANGNTVSDPSDCTRKAPIVFAPLFKL